jgi:hypothetical protein
LKADSVLNALGIGETTMFNSNDVDTPNVRPMMVFRWGQVSPGMDVMRLRTLQIWVHDKPSDYTVIDSALERVRNVLTSLFGVNVAATNKWVAQIDWELDSDDLSDDVQNTVTRYSQFRVVGSAS